MLRMVSKELRGNRRFHHYCTLSESVAFHMHNVIMWQSQIYYFGKINAINIHHSLATTVRQLEIGQTIAARWIPSQRNNHVRKITAE